MFYHRAAEKHKENGANTKIKHFDWYRKWAECKKFEMLGVFNTFLFET
jgi:hypothetical protein